MILTIIQARLGSTRLPGKILMPIAGKPILQHVYDAAPEPKAVAILQEELPELFAATNGMTVDAYPGIADDVLGRFHYVYTEAAKFMPITWILRLTADCPMLTREIVNNFIRKSIELSARWDGDGEVVSGKFIGNYEYLGDWAYDTIYTNRPWDPDGYDMELFSTKALTMAHEQATDPYDREHVTAWLYRHLNVRRFSIFGREPGPEKPEEKVSVDTREDYDKVRKIMEDK